MTMVIDMSVLWQVSGTAVGRTEATTAGLTVAAAAVAAAAPVAPTGGTHKRSPTPSALRPRTARDFRTRPPTSLFVT